MAHDQLRLDLLDGIHRNADYDQQRRSPEIEVEAHPLGDPQRKDAVECRADAKRHLVHVNAGDQKLRQDAHRGEIDGADERDARQNAIDSDLAEAQKLRDASGEALKTYESELAAARSRAQAIGNETREKLNAASETERKRLEEQLSLKLAEAEKSIAATRASAMRNVRGIAAEAATAIVQRLTGLAPDGKSVDSAVDASLKG